MLPLMLKLYLVAAAALVLAAGWTYWRLIAPRTPRLLLAGARTLLLLTLLAMLAGPQLVQRTERVERDWVVVLADRSRSMTLADVDTSRGGPRDTRAQAVGEYIHRAGVLATDTGDDLAQHRAGPMRGGGRVPDLITRVPSERAAQPLGGCAAAKAQMPRPGQRAPAAFWGQREQQIMGIGPSVQGRILVAMDHDHNRRAWG